MIIAFLAAILALITPTRNAPPVQVIPPMPTHRPLYPMPVYYDPNESSEDAEELEWELYRSEARTEYAAEFTALFNSYETKRTKNGRVMIRQGNAGSFKFAKTK